MASVKPGWLVQHMNKLVDEYDLILLQHCMKLQAEADWFELPNAAYADLYGSIQNKHQRKRKARLVKAGVLERKYHPRQNTHLYRLAANE